MTQADLLILAALWMIVANTTNSDVVFALSTLTSAVLSVGAFFPESK